MRADAADLECLVALHEPDAVPARPDGTAATGAERIREFHARLLADRPRFTAGRPHPALRLGTWP